MDKRLKPCTTFQHRHGEYNGSDNIDEDRLSSLPSELLIYLLSFLPTKDTAATCILSRRLCRVFPSLTTLDFDATHIRHCFNHPSSIQHFPSFVAFVNVVLRVSHSQHLTKFRLRVGVDFFIRHHWECYRTSINCFPDLKSSQVNLWISFPLTRFGLTELDIRLLIKEPGDAQLPPEIFTCESLEVLKLDVNLGFGLVSTFRLPKLKLCHLQASLFAEEDFLTRLVSSCPLLEDFSLEAYYNHLHCASMSLPSLRRLYLKKFILVEDTCTDVVLINAPKLEYLYYSDNLAWQYSVQNMLGLVKAVVSIQEMFLFPPSEVHHQQVFNLIRPLSNVLELSLLSWCFKGLDSSPGRAERHSHRSAMLELEEKFFRATQTIVRQCCRVHLKIIVIKKFCGSEREVNLIQFLLRKTSVLEELVIIQELRHSYQVVDKMSIESTLKMLPRASQICSIQVMN